MFFEWFCLFLWFFIFFFSNFLFFVLAWVDVVDSIPLVSRLYNRGLWHVGGFLGALRYNVPFEDKGNMAGREGMGPLCSCHNWSQGVRYLGWPFRHSQSYAKGFGLPTFTLASHNEGCHSGRGVTPFPDSSWAGNHQPHIGFQHWGGNA